MGARTAGPIASMGPAYSTGWKPIQLTNHVKRVQNCIQVTLTRKEAQAKNNGTSFAEIRFHLGSKRAKSTHTIQN